MGKLWGREPAAVLALVQAVIALALSFGFDLSSEQVGAIVTVTALSLGLLTRSRVSPVSGQSWGTLPPQKPQL